MKIFEFPDVDCSPEALLRRKKDETKVKDIIGDIIRQDDPRIREALKAFIQSEFLALEIPPNFDEATMAEIRTVYMFARWALRDFARELDYEIRKGLDNE